MNPTDLHIVIPVHNRKALTRGCLTALARQTLRGFTTVVVDDGSTDGTAEMLAAEFPETVVLQGDGHLWWSAATNLGLEWSLAHHARWIMTLNDDTLPRPEFIEQMLLWAERTPRSLLGAFAVDAKSGKAVYGGERIRWLTAGFTDLLDEIPPDQRRGLHEVTHYPGRGLLIPAEVFGEIGLFDARRFPQAAADYDFTLRARRAGWKIFANHDAVLEIFPGESGDARLVGTRSVGNYLKHLFDIRGGGNLGRFVVFAVRNCPPGFLPTFVAAGVCRRVGGYPLYWVREVLGNGIQPMSIAESAPAEVEHTMPSAGNTASPRRHIAFITNFCAHYSVGTFEHLAARHDVAFYFFSAGGEWYWQQEHGVRSGRFQHRYLPGFSIGRTRITPTLPLELLRHRYEVYVKSIHGRFALPATYLVARLKRRPFVLWTGIWFRVGTRAHRLAFPLTRYIYRHSDAIVVYGEHVKRYLVEEGVSPDRIFVSTHAVDNASYGKPVAAEVRESLRRELNIAPATQVVLYLGRLEKVKGLDVLIRAFSQLNEVNAVLVLAGEGSEGTTLRALAQDLGVADRCRFAGYVPVDRTPSFYAASSVLVLPSVSTPEVIELWGLVVNEAFNQGLPAVVTNAVGAAAGGMVQDGVNGFVVPQRDPEALARALGVLLRQPEARERMGRAARDTVSRWTQERMASAFEAAVEFALQTHKARPSKQPNG